MAKAGIQFNKNDEWYTPKEVVDYFGPFDYDPATTKEKAKEFKIRKYDTIKTDGLKRDWTKFKKIWVNPPFTRKFEFLKKAVHTVEDSTIGTEVYFLTPIESLTTKAFHDIVWGGSYQIYLPNGRIKFDDGSGRKSSPAFGCVVLRFTNDGSWVYHWELVNEVKEQ